MAATSGIFQKLGGWKTVLGIGSGAAMGKVFETLLSRFGKDAPPELKELKESGQLQEYLTSLKADTDTAAEISSERIGGLDRLMRTEREVASQAPPGTQAATPVVDRMQVLMPELLERLRKRSKGGLWADLTPGEVLIEGGPTSRENQKAADQQLEVDLYRIPIDR